MSLFQVLGFRVHKKEELPVLEGEIQGQANGLGQSLQGILHVFHTGFDQVFVPDHLHLFVSQEENVVFRRDVVIELPHGHPRGKSDFTNSRPMISFLKEQAAGGVDDLLVFGINEFGILCRGWDQIFAGGIACLFHGCLTLADGSRPSGAKGRS